MNPGNISSIIAMGTNPDGGGQSIWDVFTACAVLPEMIQRRRSDSPCNAEVALLCAVLDKAVEEAGRLGHGKRCLLSEPTETLAGQIADLLTFIDAPVSQGFHSLEWVVGAINAATGVGLDAEAVAEAIEDRLEHPERWPMTPHRKRRNLVVDRRMEIHKAKAGADLTAAENAKRKAQARLRHARRKEAARAFRCQA